MIKPGPIHRLLLPTLVLVVGFAGLAVRLVWLQVVEYEKWREIAEHNTQRRFLHESRRGDILDANGNPLTINVPVKRLFANPRLIGPYSAEVAHVLAPLLNRPEADLAKLLRPVVVGYNTNRHQPITNAYVNLHIKVRLDQWPLIPRAMTQLNSSLMFKVTNVVARKFTGAEKIFYRGFPRAVYASDDQQRTYPSKNLAAHVVGFAQEREREFNDKGVFELVGCDGIEAWFNSKLAGVRGWRVTETDNRHHEIIAYREQDVEPKPGLNVVLTLDMFIQKIVEDELAEAMKQHAPISASAIVVRPRTGEILALATLPDYDPNRPGDAPEDARRNRVITDIMEPGSTFKIVVVAGALEERLVKLTDMIFCENGHFYYLGKLLKDHGSYGWLSVEGIITKSSNIGAAKLGLLLGEERLYQYMCRFGFGTNTGVTLGGEVRGIVNPPKRWDRLMITRIPMGQSVAVTPLQVIMAMSALANDGKLMRPLLVKALRDHNGDIVTQYEPQFVRQAVSESVAHDLVKALKTVVTKDGTAPKAGLIHFTVAGKTGTAEKPCPGGYLKDKYISSFVGFYPADAPEVCIFVMLDSPQNGYYGGQVAAPYFKNMAEQIALHLKIRPDRLPESEDKLAGATNGLPASALTLRNP